MAEIKISSGFSVLYRSVFFSLGCLIPFFSCLAWSGFDVHEGNIRLAVDAVPPIADPARAALVRVQLENTGQFPKSGTVTLREFVDGWHAVGAASKAFRIASGGKTSLDFRIASNPPVYNALYPVHAFAEFTSPDGAKRTLHAVRIFEVRLPAARDRDLAAPPPLKPIPVPANTRLPLRLVEERTVCWKWFDKTPFWKPAGWQGWDSKSRAFFQIQAVSRGDRRQTLAMHPPWQQGAGTIFCNYRLSLPPGMPASLSFGIAIRNNMAQEPPSDGVLFRVWVGKKSDASDARVVFDHFTATKKWKDYRVDLSPWAGKTILLRFESNPGPKHDTTCDLSYWGDPAVIAGKIPAPEGEKAETQARIRQALVAARDLIDGRSKPNGRRTFLLSAQSGRTAAALVPGRAGLLDAAFAWACEDQSIAFSGLRIELDDLPVSPPAAVWTCRDVGKKKLAGGGSHWEHVLEFKGQRTTLTVDLRPDGAGLRISVACNRRITHFSVGPWTERTGRVYFGHGYCVTDPKPFAVHFGGHTLATSHVAAEFANGLAVLQASDNPPDTFVVRPASQICALSTHMNATLTLVPGPSAFQCAEAYRPLYSRQPAGGVKRLAGRCCFDVWGGRYADIADHMAQMFRYGLTDSFLTVHAWQRWGYDYRLPDVFPPNPAYGTIDGMRKIAAVCSKHDVPWGLHDNYIDFYPDATGYTYRNICFTKDGQPIRAWFNAGRKAQSYRWRPDRILPFVRRNLKTIRPELHPTHYFLDVFTSASCFDFYDSVGQFHPGVETREKWGEVFAWIRATLGGNAPTTSEAGHDQLIGWLDGADCQWLTLSPEHKPFTQYLPCKDWERVPWFDAVNHARFILHGVGYSRRYQGGKSRPLHGINSDDYLSAEVLSGHALMVDAGSWGRAAARKYWFLQDVARRLALRAIVRVQFDGENIHRQTITWDDGTTVRVNRGEKPWTVAGHVLPRDGFLVGNGGRVLAALEDTDGHIQEWSIGPNGWYLNARTESPEPHSCVDILPEITRFEYAGDRSCRYAMAWHANEATTKPMRIFVHFCSVKSRRSDGIVFQDDHTPTLPTDRWHGVVRITRTVELPVDADGDYRFMVGLYGSGRRPELRGAKVEGDSRAWVGTLHVVRKNGRISNVTLAPPPPPEPLPRPRLNSQGTVVDAGFATTDGAFRIERRGAGLRLIPLPDSRPFRVVLRPVKLSPSYASVRVQSVEAIPMDAKGAVYGIPFTWKGDELRFRHDGKAFAYDIVW